MNEKGDRTPILLRQGVLGLLLACLMGTAFMLTPSDHARAEDSTVCLVSVLNEKSELSKRLAGLYTELFRRLDLELCVIQAPPDRAQRLVCNNQADGEFMRGRDHSTPCLLQVAEPVVPVKGVVAMTTDPDFCLACFQELKQTNLSIDCLQGFGFVNKKVKLNVTPGQMTIVNSVEIGLRRLAAGRSELFIAPYVLVERYLSQKEFSDIRIAGTLVQTEGHMYLSKRDRDLVGKVSDILRKMKRDGAYQAIMGDYGFPAKE